jgi:hypothetical protein
MLNRVLDLLNRAAKYALLSLFLSLAIWAFSATAGHAQGLAAALNLSPFWDWKVIETEHFRITFPVTLSEVALKAAGDLEEANAILSKSLYWESPRKVPILLIDNADSANGLTSPLERFGIALYLTPPDDWYSTAYYDDWLRLLCFHEYTHFLNMDATRGAWTAGRYLFGDILLPTASWPSWMLEGLAVYDETRYTTAGRGRSPYYDMILRTAAEENVLDTGKNFTLDRIDSLSVPYYPGGEAVYLFGYELMNEVAKNNKAGPTADKEGQLKSGEDALGVMSYRSSWRIPYFINGNLENITGRDWYSYWDQFISETRERSSISLTRIRSQPVTEPHLLTHNAYLTLGSSFSPDGHWVAYTAETLDQKNSLYLRDLQTGKERLIGEKVLGAQLSFTPDSKFVIYSSLKQEAEYYLYSELVVYSLQAGTVKWMTSKERARDPDVSRDGLRVVYTVTGAQKTDIFEADLSNDKGTLKLKNARPVYTSAALDNSSSPKYSADGRTVYFTLHRNGHTSEELMAVDVASKVARVLVDNGKFNRYPAVSKNGDVVFVSDLTGVDNLYRYRAGARPELLTNLTTGIAFPSFDTQGGIHGSVFSSTGWDLATIDPLPKKVAPESVTIPPPAAPAPSPEATAKPPVQKYEIGNYSVFPSIWPRAWIPYLAFTPGNLSIGESISGYDAVDRHRYALNIGYDTLSSSADWFGEYQNRTLGPTLSFIAGDQLTSTSYFNGSIYDYTRDEVFTIAIEYPFLWTFSDLTPSAAFTLDKTYYKFPGFDTPTLNYDYQTNFLPTLDVVLGHSSAERSRLAISPEKGRDLQIGTRYYISNGDGTMAIKGLVADTEYLRLGDSHVVLVPAVQGSYTSANPATNNNLNSDVILRGHLPILIGSFANTSLSQLPIRGYPNMTFYVKGAVVTSLDLRFPLANVFRGWGTNPLFLDQIYGFVFGEATTLPYGYGLGFNPLAQLKVLPSTGGGLIANLETFIDIPVTISGEYHYGFRSEAGGAGELFATLAYTGFAF